MPAQRAAVGAPTGTLTGGGPYPQKNGHTDSQHLLPPLQPQTGFANHLARPLFRERQSDDMSEAAAVELMYDALRVCYYRDKQSINKFQLAKVGEREGPYFGGVVRHEGGAAVVV